MYTAGSTCGGQEGGGSAAASYLRGGGWFLGDKGVCGSSSSSMTDTLCVARFRDISSSTCQGSSL